MDFASRAHSYLGQHAAAQLPARPVQALRRFLTQEGFGMLAMRELKNPFDEAFEDALEHYDGPPDLRTMWMKRRGALHDEGVRQCRKVGIPLRWSAARRDARGVARQIFEEFERFGMVEGVLLAHFSIDRPPVVVSIEGCVTDDLTDEDLLSLHLVVTHFVSLWLADHPVADESLEHLSPREVEILAASSVGLSGAPLAETLGISPNTVQSYLRSIRTKLGAKTMPHAVQIAVSRGVIAA